MLLPQLSPQLVSHQGMAVNCIEESLFFQYQRAWMRRVIPHQPSRASVLGMGVLRHFSPWHTARVGLPGLPPRVGG